MTEQQVAAPPSPYKGLAPFEDSSLDALFFFGREREREIVAANLLAYRLTVLYGASGVGKSSLLRAGVAHRLRSEGEAVVVFDTWSGDAVPSLLEEVRETLEAPIPDTSDGLAGSLAALTVSLGRELYLVLDQFDEYFLYHENEDDFARELAEVATRRGLRVNVLISIRDDMLSRLDRFKALIPNLFSNYLRLDHLDRRSAREAIVGPVDRYNALVPADERVTADPELVEAVLDQSSSDGRTEAPYLQLVMQRLWEEERTRGSQRLTLDTLERLGGAGEIVRAHLDEALDSLSPRNRELAAKLFNHLVTPSGTKIAHGLGDLAQYAAVSEDEVAPVLGALVDERILRPVTAPGQPDGSRYEIFHDVLAEPITGWRSRHETERELEQTRQDALRRHRRLLVLAGAALLAVAVMVGVTVYAFSQRSAARSEARRAHARALAADALIGLGSDPQKSLQRAVEAARLSPSPQIEDTLRSVLLESHERAVLPEGGAVRDVAFSPNGERIGAGGADRSVYLYTRAGRLVRRVSTGGAIESVVFSRNGRFLAAASADGTVRVLDGRTGRPLRTLHHPHISAVSFGGAFLITAGDDGAARVWRSDGGLVAVLRNPGPVSAAALNGNGRLAVTVATDREGHSKARIFLARTGRLLRVLPQLGVITASYSPNNGIVATGSADNTARLWNARTGRLLGVLEHKGHVVDLDFSRAENRLATASRDGVGRIWDVASGARLLMLPGATQPLTGISFDPSVRFVVVASGDGNAYVYRTKDSLRVSNLAGHAGPVLAAAFSPDARRVATASLDGTARIWDPGAADQLRLVRRVSGPVTAAFSPDGKIVTRPFRRPGPPIARSPNGKLVARARDSQVVVSDSATGKTYTLQHEEAVTDVEFSRDGKLIATASRDDTARIWFARSGHLFQKLVGAFGDVEAASFSPDGRWLVTAGPTAAILWRAATGDLVFYLRGHRPPKLTSASFSPDGRRIVTASLDRTVRVYDCEVCGGLNSLLSLAERRLARISTQPK